MFSPSDYNNAVPQFTNGNYASNPLNPLYVEEPSAVDYNRGVEPLQTLPAQWWNWLANKFTLKFNKLNIYVKNIFDELTQLLALVGITPDATESSITTGQLRTMFSNNYPTFLTTNNDIKSSENEVFNRYTVANVNIKYASTGNLTLNGVQTVDGATPENGDIILVVLQSDATENGLYEYDNSGDWSRVTAFDTNPNSLLHLIFSVKDGTANKGKMFYLWNESFSSNTFGTDDIIFNEYMGSVEPTPNKVAVRDNSGRVKTADPVNPLDAVNYRTMSQQSLFIYPVGSIYWTGKAPDDGGDPNILFGGTWVQIKDTFIWAKGDSDTLNATGGAKTVTLTTSEMPSHSHGGATESGGVDHTHSMTHGHSITDGGHTHATYAYTIDGSQYAYLLRGGLSDPYSYLNQANNVSSSTSNISVNNYTGDTGAASAYSHTHSITAEGGGGAHENMPPYLVKYCWERTA